MTRILAPTDFSTHSLAGLTQAVPYTKAVRGELLLLHVVEGEPLCVALVTGGRPGISAGIARRLAQEGA